MDGTAISSSLDRALPSLHDRALLGKLPEIGDISSKGHGFVSIDENGATVPVPSKARPTMLAFPSSVVLSNRLSRWARKWENKRIFFDAGWP